MYKKLIYLLNLRLGKKSWMCFCSLMKKKFYRIKGAFLRKLQNFLQKASLKNIG